MPDRKIATCCYCGSRTLLTLRGRVQHQLACSVCGAPLSAMKALRLEPEAPPRHRPAAPPPARPRGEAPRRKRRKPFAKRALDRIEDIVEDILDILD